MGQILTTGLHTATKKETNGKQMHTKVRAMEIEEEIKLNLDTVSFPAVWSPVATDYTIKKSVTLQK